jgi:hypothetical protein
VRKKVEDGNVAQKKFGPTKEETETLTLTKKNIV